MRINKFLAHYAGVSRREGDKLIEAGRVLKNGKKTLLGEQINPEKDVVALDGKVITADQEKKYIALHKPVDVVSTVKDTHGRKTVIDLVDENQKVYPVGRLDSESEGLILLTNDGELTYRLTHPKFHIPKKYQVWVDGLISKSAIEKLRRGVRLDEGMTAPAEVEEIQHNDEGTVFQIILHEGKNRQIRRMIEALGQRVIRLQRLAIGKLSVENLQPGSWRELSKEEVRLLRQQVGL